MKILPLTYLGSVEWFAALESGDAVIDLGENYVKQSCRNRCRILSANGVMDLTVNVVKGGSMKKRSAKDMRIDYSKRWQHEHLRSIMSAYKASPYYDYFADSLNPLYEKKYEFLADFNLRLVDLILRLSGSDVQIKTSDVYMIASENDMDLRGADFLLPSSSSLFKPYYQVFSERFDFVPNLSIIDLLFCEGPDSIRQYCQSVSDHQLR